MVPTIIAAKAFVSQYYIVLAGAPDLLHTFYKDTSKFVRVEDDGSTSITTTTRAISEKIISLNNGGNVEVTSVDAQKSPNRDIHILVTGYETGRDNIVRDFVQTFLLALMETGRMEKGYYVLHDMFRYVGRSNQIGVNQVKEVEQEVYVPGQLEDRSTDLEIDDWVLCSGSP